MSKKQNIVTEEELITALNIDGNKSTDVTGKDAQSGLGHQALRFQGGTHPEGFKKYFRKKVTTTTLIVCHLFVQDQEESSGQVLSV